MIRIRGSSDSHDDEVPRTRGGRERTEVQEKEVGWYTVFFFLLQAHVIHNIIIESISCRCVVSL